VNAPLVIPGTRLAPSEAVYAPRCEACAVLFFHGQLSLHDAVDELQSYAVQSGLVDAIGQDEAQAIMSCAFAGFMVDFLQDAEGDPDTTDVMSRWELDDPRGRWKHTGEAPPPAEVRSGPLQPAMFSGPPYRTPQSTVDAFLYVARLDDSEYLARWLADHKRDGMFLLKTWKATQ
jgi:hypothetical protein